MLDASSLPRGYAVRCYIVAIQHCTVKEKGRYLTQSYDKSPYTNRNVKRAK